MSRLVPLILLCAAGAASAGEPIDRAEQIWRRECGACHIPYPASMLPPASWRKLMDGLDRHFDEDASLDAREVRLITDYLLKFAANPKYFDSVPLRVSETPRFYAEHKKIEPEVIRRPAIKSLANCHTCHPNAAQDGFEDHEVVIPE